MKKIRIGKDIVIRWTILTNGESMPLEGRDLKLFVNDSMNSRMELLFTVSGNNIEALFRGIDQKRLGKYRLTLWENYHQENQSVVDYCDVFFLVDSTCDENDGVGGGQPEKVINLDTSNLEIISKNGIYSPRIRYIHTITQEEYDSLEVKDENTLYIVL